MLKGEPTLLKGEPTLLLNDDTVNDVVVAQVQP